MSQDFGFKAPRELVSIQTTLTAILFNVPIRQRQFICIESTAMRDFHATIELAAGSENDTTMTSDDSVETQPVRLAARNQFPAADSSLPNQRVDPSHRARSGVRAGITRKAFLE